MHNLFIYVRVCVCVWVCMSVCVCAWIDTQQIHNLLEYSWVDTQSFLFQSFRNLFRCCCSVLQCATVSCSVLQCVAVCCRVMLQSAICTTARDTCLRVCMLLISNIKALMYTFMHITTGTYVCILPIHTCTYLPTSI